VLRWIDASEVAGRIARGEEMALLDVREQWDYCRGHALPASSCPLGSIELSIARLVPRRSAPIAVMDDGSAEMDSLAVRATATLASLGFSDVSILRGGVAGWVGAGYSLFTGIHSFSKLFGEFVDHRYRPPTITADEFRASSGTWVLVDVRPRDEYARATLPGSINIPAGELLRAIPHAPDGAMPLVLHCGGRTRGIIAAQTLREAGVPHPVHVLENGTIGWRLSNRDTVRGADMGIAPVPEVLDDRRRKLCQDLLKRSGAQQLDAKALVEVMAALDRKTTYFLDVRTKEEFDLRHHPMAVHAPAGQLVQETDRFIATRNARLVLLDGEGDRAAFAALWLKMMGWRDLCWAPMESWLAVEGPGCGSPVVSSFGCPAASRVEAAQARAMIEGGEAAVLDLSTSLHYEAGHVPGAFFAIRSQIRPRTLAPIAGKRSLILVSEDGLLAEVAGGGVAAIFAGAVLVLDGGMAAWRAAGLATEEGPVALLHPPHDVRRSIYQQPGDVREAMRGYIEWEQALAAKARTETYLSFLPRQT
jgi:rhodanese-related sulfurtransferase